jgi:hypothetical protein
MIRTRGILDGFRHPILENLLERVGFLKFQRMTISIPAFEPGYLAF